MKYDELIKTAIDCLRTFNDDLETPDSHAEEYLKKVIFIYSTVKLTKDSNERMFIKQVFYGVLQYKEFLKIFTNKLFEMNKGTTSRKDETLYQIFVYLTVFRLEELPLEEYKNLIQVKY